MFDVLPAAGLYAHAVIDPCPPFLQNERTGVSVAWRFDRSPYTRADPMVMSTSTNRTSCYVGFGTVPLFAKAPAEVATAVDACVSRGFRTVVTTTDGALRNRLLSAHGDQVVVREFVSFAGLLPRCDVVVCHAGAGTVLAALAAILVARGAPSQLRMASACEASGVAVVTNAMGLTGMEAAVDAATTDASPERACDAAGQISAMPVASELVITLEEPSRRKPGRDCTAGRAHMLSHVERRGEKCANTP